MAAGKHQPLVLQLPAVCLVCRLLGEEEGVDGGVNIYPAEERAQHSAEATDDFKMSFSSSLPCNSAAALKKNKYQHLNQYCLKHPETLTTAKCHRNTEDASDVYRVIQSQFMKNDLMKKIQLYSTMISRWFDGYLMKNIYSTFLLIKKK